MSTIITLEEHFLSKAALAGLEGGKGMKTFPPTVKRRLLDLGDERLQEMDKNGITTQVLSHAPTDQNPDTCIQINNEVNNTVQSSKGKFAAFAVLPLSHPTSATTELRRCVQQLGFVGTLIPNHVQGRHLDDETFWPIFAEAETLNVPVYIHPQFATPAMTDFDYKGNYGERATLALSSWCWGWHSSTGVQILRLFAAGFFDRHPRIKIVLGHMGEMLPFMLERIIHFDESIASFGKKERSLREVWDANIWITTAGMFTLAPFACLLRVTRRDRIMFSVDYPFEDNADGMKFLELVEESGLLSREEMALFTHGNAEALLGLRVVKST